MEGAHVKESSQHSIDDLNVRSKEVFRLLVESYLDTGDPVGSRTLTRSLSENISAATIRKSADVEFCLFVTNVYPYTLDFSNLYHIILK